MLDPRLLALMIEHATVKINEIIAKEGLVALKRILDNSGFADSPYLKDYLIFSEITSDSINFSIELNEKAIQDESKRKMRKENEDRFKHESKKVKNRPEAREFVSIYMMGPDGRPERIQGSRNAVTKRKEARRLQKDRRKISSDRDITRHPEESGERYVEHDINAVAPRGIEVENDGKLRITMQREIRNTNSRVIFPQGSYQGIVKKLIEEISELMKTNFSRELNSILSGYGK